VARQDHDSHDWYIGGVTNETGRRVHISLDFLSDGVYQAEIYADGDDAHYRDNQFSIKIEQKSVRRNDSLDLYLAPGGGFAIKLKQG